MKCLPLSPHTPHNCSNTVRGHFYKIASCTIGVIQPYILEPENNSEKRNDTGSSTLQANRICSLDLLVMKPLKFECMFLGLSSVHCSVKVEMLSHAVMRLLASKKQHIYTSGENQVFSHYRALSVWIQLCEICDYLVT